MRAVLLVAIGVAIPMPARADVSADITKSFTAFVEGITAKQNLDGVELLITPYHSQDAIPDADSLELTRALLVKPKLSNVKVATSKAGKSAWIAAEVSARVPAGKGKRKDGSVRASAFLALEDKTWHVKAAHLSLAVPNTSPGMCGALSYEWAPESSVPKELVAPVKALVAALASNKPAELVKLLSDDKSALAIGTAAGEKFVGGPAIKSVFKKWSLGAWYDDSKPELPARANIGPDGEMMWVAMGVNSPQQFCTMYRTLFVVAKEPSGWKIVHHHYSERVNEFAN